MSTFPRYSPEDIIALLGKEDGEWFNAGCRIPYGYSDLWEKRAIVNQTVNNAIASGELVALPEQEFHAPRFYVISDDMGINGVLNPVDGKKYDSKSSYEKAVKAAGCVIMGNDAPKERATPKQEKIDWENAVAETIKNPR